MGTYSELNPGSRILMGPGPSDVDPRVLRAMSTPLVGHLDPDFLQIMNETRDLLRTVFETQNTLTVAMSGTGSAGMETTFVNLVEPGDKVVVGINGVFGQRMVDIVERCGGEVIPVEAEWGRIIEPDAVRQALKTGDVKVVAVVHAETSTGVLQPLQEIADIVHEHGALFLADTVTSLGGVPVRIDDTGIDVAYSGTQKCLSVPPGLAPVTLNDRAMDKVRSRSRKVQSWYLDLTMIENYWGEQRFYHHTAPITMIYALREGLRLVVEEGLEARFARHRRLSASLKAGIQALGMSLFAQAGYRAPMLTSVVIPEGIDDVTTRKALLNDYGIEIGGGLGAGKGKVWRIGLMGASCTWRNVEMLLSAFADIFHGEGLSVSGDEAVAAAREAMATEDESV